MAEDQNGQEKTEEPTQKRIQDARRKGQTPRSRELSTLIAMLFSATALLFLGPWMSARLLDDLSAALGAPRELIFDPEAAVGFFLDSLFHGLFTITPLLGLLVVFAVVGNLLVGGWNFSWEALRPKWSKVDPIQGTKRIVSARSLVELVKALLKVALVGALAAAVMWWWREEIMVLGLADLPLALGEAGELLVWFFLLISSALVVVAAIDIPFQIWEHRRQLKMTLREVKEERKQTEGSPEVKARIRQAQMAMAQQRMMAEVPKADVVITNPSHFAVALRYDQASMGAPKVVAKGQDELAARIREIARDNEVPLVASPPLARALYFSTRVDEEIPAGLYEAVARVLAYLYQIQAGRGRRPKDLRVDDVPIPPEFRR